MAKTESWHQPRRRRPKYRGRVLEPGRVITGAIRVDGIHSTAVDIGKAPTDEIARSISRDEMPPPHPVSSSRVNSLGDGCGMTGDVRRQAFDPLFTTRRDKGCTGLGLHIVHNIVTNRLNGRLTLESEPGRGTEIQVILPVSTPPE